MPVRAWKPQPVEKTMLTEPAGGRPLRGHGPGRLPRTRPLAAARRGNPLRGPPGALGALHAAGPGDARRGPEPACKRPRGGPPGPRRSPRTGSGAPDLSPKNAVAPSRGEENLERKATLQRLRPRGVSGIRGGVGDAKRALQPRNFEPQQAPAAFFGLSRGAGGPGGEAGRDGEGNACRGAGAATGEGTAAWRGASVSARDRKRTPCRPAPAQSVPSKWVSSSESCSTPARHMPHTSMDTMSCAGSWHSHGTS